jgi:hypothetical protein
MTTTAKKPNVPIAIERKVKRLEERIIELEAVCKQAHDTIADVVGAVGSSLALTSVDVDKTFRELVRVLFIDRA